MDTLVRHGYCVVHNILNIRMLICVTLNLYVYGKDYKV